uniref:KIB1-4 beta-propeller domain-containing protein n=1 Tax=Leersia perrieri TaxID=77586 RepID=A0A0D9VZQ8_9ORYZ
MDSSSSIRLPCLALEHTGAKSNKPTRFSITEKKTITNNGEIPGLTNTNAWTTPQGWILVRDKAESATFLQNPYDSYNTIQLPHLLQDDLPSSCTCLFSFMLSGCVVILLIHPIDHVIYYCHIGDNEWIMQNYNIGTQVADDDGKSYVKITRGDGDYDDYEVHEKIPIGPIASRDGKFYFNADGAGNLGVLEFTPKPKFTSIKVAVDGEGLDDVDSAMVFLVESGAELYMVTLVYEYGGGGMTDCETRVHRLDFTQTPPRWRRARSLGGSGRAFLLEPLYFGASCSAGECGLEADCVYMFYPGSDDACVKISSVRERGGEEFVGVPAADRALWVLHVDS